MSATESTCDLPTAAALAACPLLEPLSLPAPAVALAPVLGKEMSKAGDFFLVAQRLKVTICFSPLPARAARRYRHETNRGRAAWQGDVADCG